jgi:hypothetical protein
LEVGHHVETTATIATPILSRICNGPKLTHHALAIWADKLSMADKHRIGTFCRREDVKFRNYGRDQGLAVMEKHLIFDMDIPEWCGLWDPTEVILEG